MMINFTGLNKTVPTKRVQFSGNTPLEQKAKRLNQLLKDNNITAKVVVQDFNEGTNFEENKRLKVIAQPEDYAKVFQVLDSLPENREPYYVPTFENSYVYVEHEKP